jgi:glycyl-tRNA synthetase beta chain
MCLAIADKLDTIVCAWATGKKPTGSGDPFMVRRSALGILRILRENALDIAYGPLLTRAVDLLPGKLARPALHDELAEFFQGRLAVMAKSEGRDVHLTKKALPAGSDPTNVLDFWLRLDALEELAKDERFIPLCELVDRTKTITEKNGADVDPADVDVSRLEHDAEKALHTAIEGCRDGIRAAIDERRYVEAGQAYVTALAEVTHIFFEPAPAGVFVMHDDERLRTNRLALLKQIHALLADGFADLAAKEEKGKKKNKKR